MRAGRVFVGAVALTACWIATGGAALAAKPKVVLEDGRTAPVFGYADAIRERVFIPLPRVDQDGNGAPDRTAIELTRPKATGRGLKAPAIIDPSPYYTTGGRGHESQRVADLDGDGLNDRWPLFYDNYFVPRGYAFIHAYMNGTGLSTGCPMHGGPGDVASMKAVIDWLNGRAPGFDEAGNRVRARWHNGRAAMIGKSYDGTLANGVAATGVKGLKTIVPISAISQWYGYSRTGGIRHNTDYAGNVLAPFVTDDEDEPMCAPSRRFMNSSDGDEHGDVSTFWRERDYLKNARKVRASVFITHGLQDDNVRFNQATQWWDALERRRVPRKMWLTRTGHEDPFDFRRAEWVDTLHRWFDRWLQGIHNRIMREPKVDIEVAKDTWETARDWPIPGTRKVGVYLRGTAPGAAGALGLGSGGATDTLSWTDALQNENTVISDPTGSQANRLAFLSAPLERPLRIAGTPVVDIRASLSTPQSNLGAVLVDYGPSTQITRSSDGIIDAVPEERDCWGESSATDSACYKKVQKPTVEVRQWRVSKGILDSSNRGSLRARAATPVTPGTEYRFDWPTFPNDFVFAAGHRIGIVLVGNYPSFGSVPGTIGSRITLDTRASKVRLPIVGGYGAAAASGGFALDR